MNIYRQRHRVLTLVLLAINMLLGLMIAFELSTPGDDSLRSMATQQLPTQPGEDTMTLPQSTFALAPLAHYDEILARPLFAEERRPPEPEPDTVSELVKVETAPPPFTLVGIVIATDATKALLLPRRSRELVQGVIGDRVEGWRIEDIQPDRITVARGPESVEIELERAPGTPATTRLPAHTPFKLQQKPR